MLAHFVNWLPFAVLGTSFIGSTHCIGMCGGLIATVTRTKTQLMGYHLGRLVGYCSLGLIAGLLGQETLSSTSFSFIPWISSILLAMSFIWIGLKVWWGQSLHFSFLPPSLFRSISRLSNGGPFGTGLISALLPCGWLHTFVLGAIATRSPWMGALYLLFFWLGTLPALSLAPMAASKFFQPLAQKSPKLSGTFLILLGLATIGTKMNLFTSEQSHCSMKTSTHTSAHSSKHSHHRHHSQ